MLITLLNNGFYNILIITETWLTDNIFYSIFLPNNSYNLYGLDRSSNSRGGGILVYIDIK